MRLFCHRPYRLTSAMASVHVIPRKIIILLFDLLIIVTLTNAADQQNTGDESDALSRLKVSFNNAGVLQSWVSGTNPCNESMPWEGIRCMDGSVQNIRLEGLNLSGILDIDALLQLPNLRTVSLMSNSFSGPIPAFNKLVALKALHLSNNQFSGDIPGDYFTEMKYLKKLWLSWNRFSGLIPPSLDLIPLIELYLDHNQFSGTIPQLDQESMEQLNLSNNSLTGPIPQGLLRFDETTFEGNPGLCGEKTGKPPCPEQPPPMKKNDNEQDYGNKNHKIFSLWFMIACAVILVSMIAGIILLRRRQLKNHESAKDNGSLFDDMNESGRMMTEPKMNESLRMMTARKMNESDRAMTEPDSNESGITMIEPKDTSVLLRSNSIGSSQGGTARGINDLTMVNDAKYKFGMADLMKAAAEVLGNGTIGSSYKAMMSNRITVVVKRIKEMDNLEKDAFDAEVKHLASIKHNNVLAPVAYYYRKEEKLLITEYMPKGSLLYILHGDRGSPNTELKWPARLKIIQGIARGLFYIHTELSQMELPHGNLKSSNVLLSPDYEPLLSDYGFSSLVTSTQATRALFAYKSPEFLQNQPVSPKSDVYCMGIIILELLTGKFPSQYLNSGKGGTDVVQWARSAIAEGREVDIFDPEIGSSVNSLPEMKQLLHIGAACTESEPRERLDMREAISRIEALHYMGSPSQQPHDINSGSGPGESSRQNSREEISFEIS